MKLSPVINQLKTYCPSFQNRVAGSSRFKMLDENEMLDVPCAYVIPLDDNPGERDSLNDVRQRLVESFAVIVALDNTLNERGQTAIEDAHDTLRAEIWKALLGWQPDGLAYQSRYRGIEYQGANLLQVDRARLWYQYDFGAEMQITPDDGWQAIELDNLPHFDGVSVNVDAIDPEADPNLKYPGPDGRIEHIIDSPPTGTLP